MYIEFWADVGFNTQHPVFGAMFALLEQRNVRWRITCPQQELWRLDRLAVDADVYLIRSSSPLALGLAPALEAKGARLVNRYQASLLANDPVLTVAGLMQAHIRIPRTWVASRPAQLYTEPTSQSVVLKTAHPYQDRERMPAAGGDQMRAGDLDANPTVAQAAVRGVRDRYTVYVVSDRLFALRAEPHNDLLPAGPVRLSRERQDTARACGAALGLELYSIDMIEDADGVQVLDINSFPDYLDVPDAPQWLAEYAISVGAR